MKTDLSLEEMRKCLEIWDQTIGCSNCNEAWWAERAFDDVTLFHADGCPLRGNREAHSEAVNLEYMDECIEEEKRCKGGCCSVFDVGCSECRFCCFCGYDWQKDV